MDAIKAGAGAVIGSGELAEYLSELGGALLGYGCPTERVEELIRVVARLEGHDAQTFAVPTGLFVSVSAADAEAPQLRLVRVEDWGVDLDRLSRVDGIFNDVASRKLSIADARKQLRSLGREPGPYPLWLTLLASASATAMAALFFRGGLIEIGVAAGGGLALSGLNLWLRRNPAARFLVHFGGGVFCAGLAWAAGALWAPLSREVVVLSALILLVPGMTLTVGLSELTYKNLVAGTARLMDALVVLLSLIFGIAVAVGLENQFGLAHVPPPQPVEHPALAQLGALAVASISLGILLRMPQRFLIAAIGSCVVGGTVTALGFGALPQHVAAFLASLCTCLYANVCARWTQQPSQIFLAPGLTLLVPGSFGFRSLEALLRADVLGGAAQGFAMFLTAGALVAGILTARALLPSRKLL
jgi:uncharacterized membrane protein YjjP (DUF1212 family)